MRTINIGHEESEVKRVMAAQFGEHSSSTQSERKSSLPAPDVLLGILLEDLANLQETGIAVRLVEDQGRVWIQLSNVRTRFNESGEIVELCYENTGNDTDRDTGNTGNRL